ncbi:MAG: proline dehydrogenase family protein [Dysgonamonadaceae bacterium]|jgi:proline dehydrogenase|nr:proline dehydrogenase family protein [Dysgonamonadaceae bacterium]
MSTNKTDSIDFSNSEIAFQGKANRDLRETYLLFKVMNNAGLVKTGKNLVNFAFAIHFPIEWFIKATIYKHFVGGTSIDNCMATVDKLAERNVGAILDFAVEGEKDDALFDATAKEVIRTIEEAHNNTHIPFSAFKITGVGRFELLEKVSDGESLTEDEKREYERVRNRVDAIFRSGYEYDVPVLIDAEETWIQPMLDDLVLEMMEKYNTEKAIVQNTYQMYRHDSIERIKAHHKTACEKQFKFGLKIVRGAYMEKERARAAALNYPSPIQPDKPATDRDFDEIIRYFVDNADDIAFMVATHNENSSNLLASLIEEKKLPKNHPNIFFAQLYGMSDHITYNLAERGYNVVKYVPYGEVRTMMPYLFRRAEENTSVKGQSSRELSLIQKERKRRKNNG